MLKWFWSFPVLLLAVILLWPSNVLAHAEGQSIWPLGYWGPLVACEGNACDSLCDLVDLGQHLTSFGISLVIFAIAPVMIVYGGMMILIAGGSEERIKNGKKILTGAVLGILLALGAYLIVTTFLWLVGAASDGVEGGVQWPNIKCSVPGTYRGDSLPMTLKMDQVPAAYGMINLNG